jgi:hypothetical protein
MGLKRSLRAASRWLTAGAAIGAGAYAGYAAVTWRRYGNPALPDADEDDPLLDRFMPEYDVVDRHRIGVAAPASVTLAVAREMDLLQMPVARAIFKGREVIFGADPDERPMPRGLLPAALSLGWVVLAEITDHKIVVGAVTRPWEANVTFRSIAAEDFVPFAEPRYVKIVWTLRADPIGPSTSIFRTETRAVATDAEARNLFRWYWAFLSPGIFLIRRLSLGPLKAEAERRAQGCLV